MSDFEIEALITFTGNEQRVIEERRRLALRLALALQIGFLGRSGRLLEAVRMVPAALWQHLGTQLDVTAPDLTSLGTMISRAIDAHEVQLIRTIVVAIDRFVHHATIFEMNDREFQHHAVVLELEDLTLQHEQMLPGGQLRPLHWPYLSI